MSNWLPGARVIAGADSGPMLGGARKVVWHTTENDPKTTTAANIATYLQRTGNTVHIVWHPLTGEIVQMIAANLGAKGLENRPGGVQTNRGGTYVIQIEVVGRASQPFTSGPMVGLPKIQAWLASLGIPAVWSGTSDRSVTNWAKSGHFGHMNVPENAHWDPGNVNKAALTGGIKPPPPPPPIKTLEATMADLVMTNPVSHVPTPAVAGLNSMWAYAVMTNTAVKALAAKAGVVVDVDEKALAAALVASLTPALKAAVTAAVTAGGTPEAVADAVVAKLSIALAS